MRNSPQLNVRTNPEKVSFLRDKIVIGTGFTTQDIVNDALDFFLGSRDDLVLARRKRVLKVIEKMKADGQECPFSAAPVMA